MSINALHITTFDKERLARKIDQILIDAQRAKQSREAAYARQLAAEIDRAAVVDPKDIPADVVTMNSIVRLVDEATDREMTYALSFPADSDAGEGRVSVLAPVGIALLGGRVGDIVEWPAPKGLCRYRIAAIVYQPEAAGAYDR